MVDDESMILFSRQRNLSTAAKSRSYFHLHITYTRGGQLTLASPYTGLQRCFLASFGPHLRLGWTWISYRFGSATYKGEARTSVSATHECTHASFWTLGIWLYWWDWMFVLFLIPLFTFYRWMPGGFDLHSVCADAPL